MNSFSFAVALLDAAFLRKRTVATKIYPSEFYRSNLTAIDGEDPLVNYRVGKHIVYEPLPNRKLILNKAPPPPPKAVLNYRGVETQGASLTGEDEKMAYCY